MESLEAKGTRKASQNKTKQNRGRGTGRANSMGGPQHWRFSREEGKSLPSFYQFMPDTNCMKRPRESFGYYQEWLQSKAPWLINTLLSTAALTSVLKQWWSLSEETLKRILIHSFINLSVEHWAPPLAGQELSLEDTKMHKLLWDKGRSGPQGSPSLVGHSEKFLAFSLLLVSAM